MRQDVLEGAQDIMIYQTGLARVGKLETLRFLPGALADHLTSYGGDLLGSGQMSSLRWLEAGATASYGTVSEPCNHWQKFPIRKSCCSITSAAPPPSKPIGAASPGPRKACS